MRIRKNARYLTDQEKSVFLRALFTLKAQPQPGVSPAISKYDYFVLLHLAATRVFFSGTVHNMAHGTAMFLPWHREYILRFENALRATIPGVTDDLTLPYWDWSYAPPTLVAGSIDETDQIFRNDFLGGNGGSDVSGGATVLPSGGSMQAGYFTHDAPTPLPGWWPSGLLGWRIPNRLGVPQSDDSGTQPLSRSLGSGPALPTTGSVNTTLLQTTYATFRSNFEGASHAAGHNWFVGHMSNPSRSPSDPMFFLHHANIDRIWALWQIHGTATDTYDALAPVPYRLTDPLWPWGWAASAFTLSPWYAALPVPDHSAEAVRRPADLLDHRALGYRYDSEIVLAIVLDRSGSMAGATPDPLTGAPPNLTKWDAAVLGVQNLLQDCAVAFALREAYVTAGALLFGTGAGGNELVPVWPAPGVIRATGTYSSSGFTTALGAAAPAGGTPLGAALAQAETTLVRAPFPTSLADDPRYMAFLTDGIETAPPYLSSILNHTYAATRIYAMGFGIGSGWDGINYTGIQTIVDKGAPAIPGVNQVFHGENAGEIDKFFGDTITRALDFRHTTDPLYELAAGEHVHTPFVANASDDAFLVTVQGFDYADEKWMVELVAPSGAVFSTDVDAPVALRILRGNGRTSIMLKRDHAASADWVGTWHVRTTRLGAHAGHHGAMDHALHEMFMPELWSQLRPQGAPRIQDPLYVATGARRLPERFTPDRTALARMKMTLAGVKLPPQIADVCAVAVNISHRGRLRATLDIPARRIVAGQGFDIRLVLEGISFRDLDDVVIAGRLVAPNFSIGNLLADTRTVPLSARTLDPISGNVDLHRFLVEVQKAAPHALSIRDEEVVFEREADGSLCARIRASAHPGVHYVSVYFEATDARSPARERLRRILTTEVAVGMALDPRLSVLDVKLIGKSAIQVSFTPRDHLGNIAAPGRSAPPQLVINGLPVEVKAVPNLGAERVLEVALHAGADHGLETQCCVCCTDGQMVEFDPKRPVSVKLFWGGVVLTAGPPPAPSSGPAHPPDHDHHHGHAGGKATRPRGKRRR